ncbi:MAG: hypothetical protein ACE5NP_11820 [Anaerolineae bacterium]
MTGRVSLAQLEAELDLSVICHKGERGIDLHPTPEIVLRGNDRLVVCATLDSLRELQELNQTEAI